MKSGPVTTRKIVTDRDHKLRFCVHREYEKGSDSTSHVNGKRKIVSVGFDDLPNYRGPVMRSLVTR